MPPKKPGTGRPPRGNPTHPKAYRKRAVMEFVDFDYVHKLSDSEREWLNKFAKEYYNGEVVGEPLHSREQHLENQRRLNRLNPAKEIADGYSVARVTSRLVQPDHATIRNHHAGADDERVPSWETLLDPNKDTDE